MADLNELKDNSSFVFIVLESLSALSEAEATEYLIKLHKALEGDEQSYSNAKLDISSDNLDIDYDNLELESLLAIYEVYPQVALDHYVTVLLPLIEEYEDPVLYLLVFSQFGLYSVNSQQSLVTQQTQASERKAEILLIPESERTDLQSEILQYWEALEKISYEDTIAYQLYHYINNNYSKNERLWDLVVNYGDFDEFEDEFRASLVKDFINGDPQAYSILSRAGWVSDLLNHELLSYFLNLDPKNPEFEFAVLARVVGLEDRNVDKLVLDFIQHNPRRYKVHQLVSRKNRFDLVSVVDRLMANFENLSSNDQKSVALIGIQYGYVDAVEYLLSLNTKYITLDSEINVERLLIRYVDTPEEIIDHMNWISENLQKLRFNQQTKKYSI